MRFSVSDIKTDDDLVVSGKTVRIGTSGNKKFKTPLKPSIKTSKNNCAVHEIYRIAKPQTLEKCLNSTEYDSKYCRTTNNLRDESAVNIFSLAYGDKTHIPNDNLIRIMADLQYVNTDVIVIPSWYDLISRNEKDKSELYLKLSDKYYEYASFKNHKPVMATIPVCMPSPEIPKVLDHFMEMNITSFIIDFNARSLMNGTWLRNFSRELNPYRTEKEGILYSINAFPGIDRKHVGYVEAKDFIGFAAGFDIVGDKHTPKQSSDNYNSPRTTINLFNNNTYRYDKVPFVEGKQDDIKLASVQNQINEMTALRTSLDESESIKKILDTKSLEPTTMRDLISMKSDQRIRVTRLNQFI